MIIRVPRPLMELAVVLLYYKDSLGRGIQLGCLKDFHHQY